MKMSVACPRSANARLGRFLVLLWARARPDDPPLSPSGQGDSGLIGTNRRTRWFFVSLMISEPSSLTQTP